MPFSFHASALLIPTSASASALLFPPIFPRFCTHIPTPLPFSFHPHSHKSFRSKYSQKRSRKRGAEMTSAMRVDLDGNPINAITICRISAGGFIGSHLCEKLVSETPDKVHAVEVYSNKLKHLLEPSSLPWSERIQFHRINVKNDSRLEGLIRLADLVTAYYVLKEDESPCVFGPIEKQRW